MICQVAVTFEFDIQPPLTWRGEVEGGGPATVVRRAVVEALKAHPGRRWSSMVVGILERREGAGVKGQKAPIDAQND